MKDQKPSESDSAVDRRALRAQRIIYVAMFVFIVLPFIVAFFSGALRF